MGACQSCFANVDCPTNVGLGLPENFKVIRELGHGIEGKTYLVRERSSKGSHLFACKAIPRGQYLNPNFVLKGLRNQSSLGFIHVVKFYEVLLTHSHLIIKFEYLKGGDLFRYVCRQRFVSKHQFMEEEHTRFIFIQILVALHHCHEHRVAHRDIKFDNLLCTRSKNPIVKICDFGLSTGWEKTGTATSFSAVGSPLFMSPEVVRSHAQHERNPFDLRKADIWGLGILLYTMLFGRFPFINVDHAASMDSRNHLMTGTTSSFSFVLRNMEVAHRTDPQRLTEEISRSGLSQSVKRLLLQMLAIDEKLRISLDELMEDPWVKQGLKYPRAKAIADVWGREMSNGSPLYCHGELVPGSPADKELEDIVRSAARAGSTNAPLIRWSPPGVRLQTDMTSFEFRDLERKGIRRCTKCCEDKEDRYNALLAGIKIMP